MPHPASRAVLLALALLLGPGTARAWQEGGLAAHNHSSAVAGGSSLSPLAYSQTSGSFTFVGGGNVKFSSSAVIIDGSGSSLNITSLQFGAGTAITSYTTEVSTIVFMASGITTGNTAVGSCTSSTMTMTFGGGIAPEFWLTGNIGNGTAAASIFWNVECDGAFLDGHTGASSGASGYQTTTNADVFLTSIYWRASKPLAAGSHSCCFAFAGSAGTITLGTVVKTVEGMREPAH